MMNKLGRTCVYRGFAGRLSIHFGIFVLVLFIAPKLSAQVTSNPETEIFSASGTTQNFTITVPAGTTLGSVSVLTLGGAES